MNIKINRKFSISVSAVIILVSICSILLNTFLVDKYYIYEKRKVLNEVYKILENTSVDEFINNITTIENTSSTTIVYTESTENIEDINENIINSLSNKKIKLNKFWITQGVLDDLENKSVNKIYDQGITMYKVLTKFIKKDNYIFVVVLPLPHMYETINIVNKFNLIMMLVSVILIIILVTIISKNIVKPLNNLKVLSNDISDLNFRKETIKTNDEIEELSISINAMSESLEKAHNEINTQNQRLKDLLANVSHELKTPLALIKVYSQGIEDGLDDGTYISIVEEEIDKMDTLIEKLLFWAKIDKSNDNKSNFLLDKKILNIVSKYKLIFEENNIDFTLSLDNTESYEVYVNEEELEVTINNLITNSIKYTSNKKIKISLVKHENNIKFTIANGISHWKIESIENIWLPFYVLEKSRSKELSGTGLGLSIVKSILEKNNLKFGFNLIDTEIEFYIIF